MYLFDCFIYFKASSTVATSTWHHVAAVFNDGGNAIIYIDGQNKGSQSLNGATLSEGSQPVNIGSNTIGVMDALQIYNYALTASQVFYFAWIL